MTDATVQMLVSQLGNANIKNSSKKELMEAAAGLPDFGNILSNAGNRVDNVSFTEERGAGQSWKKDASLSDTSALKQAAKVLKNSNKPSEPDRVTGDNKEMSLSEKLGFGDGETDVEEMADALVYLTSQMMSVLTEKLNVTEEQVNNYLEQNNLIMTDLLDPTKLAEAFIRLTGENLETIDVVRDEEFSSMLAAFDNEINEIFGENADINKADLVNKSHILVDYGVVDAKFTTINVGEQVLSDDDSVVEILQDNVISDNNNGTDNLSENMENPYISEAVVNDAKTATDNIIADANLLANEALVNGEAKKTETADKNGAPTTSPDGDPNKKLVFTTGGEATPITPRDLTPREGEDPLESILRKRMRIIDGHKTGDNSEEMMAFMRGIKANANANVTANQDVPTVEFSDMIFKVQEYIETLSRDSKITSLSMQLNPENLGKVTVEVATKDGMVSAKVYADTQAAKEALQMNLQYLKTNLENQGVKIADIEVAVEAHAFEQNLQQDGSREQEQLAKEMQQETQRNLRQINLREVCLNELRGLMSEEDIVVAKMMADNGETLNIKA